MEIFRYSGRDRVAKRITILVILVATCLLGSCNSPSRTEVAESPSVLELPGQSQGGGLTDVTLAAGITAVHRLATPDFETIVDAVGAGAAFADLDNDGWLDLIVLGGPRSPAEAGRAVLPEAIHLYRNTRDGRFEDITRESGIPDSVTAVAVAVGDVDGDGDRDLYLLDRGPNRLLLNRGNAVFDDMTEQAGVGDTQFGIGAAFFDMEGDGDLDLYVVNYLDYDPRETNYFTPDGYPGPLAYKAESDRLYRNRGDGTFDDVTLESGIGEFSGRGMSLVAADLDEDGDTDIFVANDATANYLWLNQGAGRFEEAGLVAGVAMGTNGEQTSAMAADVGDVDGDGWLDLTVSDTAFGAFYRRDKPGYYVDEVMRSGIGVACAQYVSWGQNLLDFDQDGDLDLFVVNGGLHHLVGWEDLLLRNSGDGRFEDISSESGPYFASRQVGRNAITGDYDNDGDIDLFVTTLQGRHYLLRNDQDSQANWIILDLVGAGSRDPFGTQVTVVADGRSRSEQSRARTSYLGQGDSRIHFGLGLGTGQIERIEIVWPDGSEQILEDVPARQVLRIEQGE